MRAGLNTPNCENTETLIAFATGLDDALAGLAWQRHQDSQQNRDDLDEFVHDIRGQIVHKGTTPDRLNKGGVKSWISFIQHVSEGVDLKLADHLESESCTRPW